MTSQAAVSNVLMQARVLGAHLFCLYFPLTVMAYLLTGPRPWEQAAPWLLVVVLSVFWDKRSGAATRQPPAQLVAWPFDALLVVHVVLQVANLVLFCRYVEQVGFFAFDTMMAVVLVMVNSGISAIVVAHELVHRPRHRMQRLGRLLLSTVLYEHFFTEHIRGHHPRVGTDADPATARFGETYRQFFRRTVPGQFRSAWHLECKRLGDEGMPLWDRRQKDNRVLHGVVVECLLALGIGAVFGGGALCAFLMQAHGAVSLLEAVNYFEHYGLRRSGKKVATVDSWDAESRFTLYALVGLSRHADHHANATRPYQQLRHFEDSPKLPYGYFATAMLAVFKNQTFRRLMENELQRRKLGPFAEPVVPA